MYMIIKHIYLGSDHLFLAFQAKGLRQNNFDLSQALIKAKNQYNQFEMALVDFF